MKYFITYNKKTGEILRVARASGPEAMPDPITKEEAHLEVSEESHIEKIASLNLREFKLKGKVDNGKIEDLEGESIFDGKIKLTTDAKDKDKDGKPELPADGTSSARIMAGIYDIKGKPVKNKTINIQFEISRGSMSKRMAETKNGIAEVELTSSKDTTLCRVIAKAKGFKSDSLIFEFIPEEEFKLLAKGKKINESKYINENLL